jgi:hypothetical protein
MRARLLFSLLLILVLVVPLFIVVVALLILVLMRNLILLLLELFFVSSSSPYIHQYVLGPGIHDPPVRTGRPRQPSYTISSVDPQESQPVTKRYTSTKQPPSPSVSLTTSVTCISRATGRYDSGEWRKNRTVQLLLYRTGASVEEDFVQAKDADPKSSSFTLHVGEMGAMGDCSGDYRNKNGSEEEVIWTINIAID